MTAIVDGNALKLHGGFLVVTLRKTLYCNIPCFVASFVIEIHCFNNVGNSKTDLSTMLF